MNPFVDDTNMNVTDKKCVIRCIEAGVFYGTVIEKENTPSGVECTIKNCRRIWHWDGAASLSQLAMEGVSKPENCHFSVVVPEMAVIGVIEIIPASEQAIKSIESVPIWKV